MRMKVPVNNLKTIAALIVTCLAATLATLLFSVCADACARLYTAIPLLCTALPLAGLAGWGIYRKLGLEASWSTSRVISAVNNREHTPAVLLPAVFVATCITLLFGGSVGKEAGALQLSVISAEKTRAALHLDAKYSRLCMLCTLACAMATLFGAPVAAALFAFELVAWNIDRPWHIPVVIAASLAAAFLVHALGIPVIAHPVTALPLNADTVGMCLLIGSCACVGGAVYCIGIRAAREALGTSVRRQVIAIIGAGAAVAALMIGGHTFAVAGTGVVQLNAALAGELSSPFFALKLLVTVVLLGCGFKGGEFLPMLTIGATLGAWLACTCGIDAASAATANLVGFYAAFGMACFMATCTNCPFAAAALAVEFCGPAVAAAVIPAALLCSILTSGFSLYDNTRAITPVTLHSPRTRPSKRHV